MDTTPKDDLPEILQTTVPVAAPTLRAQVAVAAPNDSAVPLLAAFSSSIGEYPPEPRAPAARSDDPGVGEVSAFNSVI